MGAAAVQVEGAGLNFHRPEVVEAYPGADGCDARVDRFAEGADVIEPGISAHGHETGSVADIEQSAGTIRDDGGLHANVSGSAPENSPAIFQDAPRQSGRQHRGI